ncbi:MAG: RagB/SusD family nutrient uptake outer membrane protein [Candidatus Azobacteroides sp.]|nr:RagB/SusD family nutrient uptake outer membrane protein [Candidatus Azobacteroides sp.]
MKKIILSIVIICSLSLASCSDFLEPKSNDVISGDALSADNLDAMTAPLYNFAWYEFNWRFNIAAGDAMSFNLQHNADYYGDYTYFTFSSSTSSLGPAWGSLYFVVQSANKVIITANSTNADETEKTQCIAEARFMRGLAYWFLASMWHNAIISEDPTPLVNNPLVNVNPMKDVYEFAIRDMEFAAKYLPESSAATGRVNRYSAFGMLSRFYLAYSGYVASDYGANPNVGTRDQGYLDLAKKAAEKVIGSGKYRLLANYYDLFKIDNNNNVETLFAFQWVPGINGNSNPGLTNGSVSNLAGLGVASAGEAWGSWSNPTYNMMSEYEPADSIRRYTTWMAAGDYYPDIDIAEGGLRLGDDSKGDGIYNIGHNVYDDCLLVKKGVTGNQKDNPAINTRNSGLDNAMLRYAEVLLNYAEAVLGNSASTTDATALQYVNAVRARAGLTGKQSISWEDLRHERRIEFCMEGLYWYDLMARAYYKQQEIINYLLAQNRGSEPAFLFDAPMNLRLDASRNPTAHKVGEIDDTTLGLPYPANEIIQNSKLKNPPVPYVFTEERITDLFN